MGQVAGIALMWFLIELLLWYAVGKVVSGWYVFFWFIIAFIIGITFVRKGMATLNPMAQQMQAGGMNAGVPPNEDNMMKTVARAAAGLLLLIPGLMSDVMALILLLPPVQKKLKTIGKNYAMNNQDKMMEMMAKQMGGQSPFGGMGNMGGADGMKGQNPFSGMGNMGNMGNGQNPFGNQGTTVDGTAKPVFKDVKKITSANDD